MFRYVKPEEYAPYEERCRGILKEVEEKLAEEGILAKIRLTGSAALDLVMQNESRPIDLDFNLVIMRPSFWELSAALNGGEVKQLVMKFLNETAACHGFGSAKDSTSVITVWDLEKKFYFDLAILSAAEDGCPLLLRHNKSADKAKEQYLWTKQKNLAPTLEMARTLKEKNSFLFQRVYQRKKNMYLSRNDSFHDSYVILAETVKEMKDLMSSKKQAGVG